MKRQLSLVLALVMILGSFSSVFAAKPVETVVDAGAFLKNAGVLVGDEKGNLNLGDNLSRQDAVILVAQLRGAIEEAKAFPTLPTYKDVRIAFYNAPLAWAQAEDLFVGHSDVKFGFDEDLTAQEYAKVLLTALGYKVAPNGDSDIKWADALDKAKEFGILANVEVVNSTKVTRGQMALMTFNALGVNMKGSKETLADTLGIEMPEGPEAKELTAKVNDTENLVEVVLELSNAKLADAEKLEDINNYRVDKVKIVKVTVDGDNAILLLNEPLIKGRSYDLTVRGVDKAIDKKYSFKTNDNESPRVVDVKVLGEYGIKVTTSEPVDNDLLRERNFLIDGKNVAMEVEQYGRDIILTPYHKAAFPTNAKTLTVKELEDYAGYKAALEDFEIEMVKDDVAPEVVDVTVDGSVVEVTFDKEVYVDSVSGYVNRKNEGNISYRSGRQDIFTTPENTLGNDENYGKKFDVNKVRYTFDADLPRRTEVIIVGVQNHSKVEMEKTTMLPREVKNNLEPEIIDKEFTKTQETFVGGVGQADAAVRVTLEFDKSVKNIATGSVNDYFTLYAEKVADRYEVTNAVITFVSETADTVVIDVTGLKNNNPDKDFDYILEVKNFEDNSGNRMYRDYVEFDITATKVLSIVNVTTDHKYSGTRYVETEITIEFNRPVDRMRAEDETNYIFRKSVNGSVNDIADLKGTIITEGNGKTVTLKLPKFEGKGYDFLEVLAALRDKDNNKLTGDRMYNIAARVGVPVTTDGTAAAGVNALIAALPEAGAVVITDKVQIEAARAAYNDLSATQKGFVTDVAALVAAEAELDVLVRGAVNTLIAALPTAQTPPVAVVIADRTQIEAARAAYNDLSDTQKALVNDAALVTAENELTAILEDASITGLTVLGVVATVDSTDSEVYEVYNVELPNGTVLANLLPANVAVTATNTGATVATAETADAGITWEVVVTAEDGVTAITYTINVTVAP